MLFQCLEESHKLLWILSWKTTFWIARTLCFYIITELKPFENPRFKPRNLINSTISSHNYGQKNLNEVKREANLKINTA